MALTDYRVPPRETSDEFRLGWLRESVQEGTKALSLQSAAEDFQIARDVIAGRAASVPKGRSEVRSGHLKRQIREVVATLSNLRPMWGYHTDNPDYDHNNAVLNKLVQAWWFNTFADLGIRKAIQYAAVLGTGHLIPMWEKDYWVAGRGDIVLDAVGPEDVIPIQLPRNHDLQQAYLVLIRRETPLAQAHAMYPTFSSQIVADSQGPSSTAKAMKKIQSFFAPVLQKFGPRTGQQRREDDLNQPYVTIWHAYIKDVAINQTDRTVPMGDANTSWYYEVPAYGSEIPVGVDANGRTLMRKADFEDSMLYPMRRLCVFTPTALLKDNTSPWWHGRVPVATIQTDDWPWESLGYSLVRDNASLDRSVTELMRYMDDTCRVRLRPPLEYDKNSVAKRDMEKLDTRRENVKIGVDRAMGDGIKPLLPVEFFDIPQFVVQHVENLLKMEDYQLGVNDLSALAKATRLPSADDVEKLLQAAGPIVNDISRNMERSLRDVGEMVKSMFFQFYNARRRVQLLGEMGLVREDFDFEPGSMVPSHMPGESGDQPSAVDYFKRARLHQNNFYFQVTPGSMHSITQMSRKLLYLQLQRSGFPIDPWTMAKVFDVPDFGNPPKGTNGTVIEQWVAWERMKVELANYIQQLGIQNQVAAASAGVAPPSAPANGGGQPRPPAPGGGPHAGGRKPTAQQAPQMVTKDGGTRTTISESGK